MTTAKGESVYRVGNNLSYRLEHRKSLTLLGGDCMLSSVSLKSFTTCRRLEAQPSLSSMVAAELPMVFSMAAQARRTQPIKHEQQNVFTATTSVRRNHKKEAKEIAQ